MMLHNVYMEIEKKQSLDGGYINMPRTSFKRSQKNNSTSFACFVSQTKKNYCLDIESLSYLLRYWKVDLWKELFTKLLNRETCEDDTETLRNLRKSMEEYICSDPKLMKKLNELLAKQRISLCSS